MNKEKTGKNFYMNEIKKKKSGKNDKKLIKKPA